jgi:hypothetical protein
MRPRLTFKELRFLDSIDWPRWAAIFFVVLVVFGGLFEASHQDPWFAVVGLLVLGAIFIPMRLRQLQRRIDEYEALRRSGTEAPPAEPPEPESR